MSFNRILIPVDFTVNTEVAVKKAVELCEGPGMAIHLLHVPDLIPTSAFGYYRYLAKYSLNNDTEVSSEVKDKLEHWLDYIKKTRTDIDASYSIIYSNSVEKAIVAKSKSIAADLVIIGKNSQHSLLPFLNTVISGRIARRTGTSVLTVKPGALSNQVRTVVVPVGPMFPANKVAIINALGNKFRIHIRLLILVQKGDDPDSLQTSLLNVCRVLKNRSFNNTSYDVLKVGNKGWDILHYCQRVDADLLIVQGTEDRIGWMNKHISDQLPVNSKTQVLAVSQTNYSII
jgi:nucleotide-binding universal stress UspA family protein